MKLAADGESGAEGQDATAVVATSGGPPGRPADGLCEDGGLGSVSPSCALGLDTTVRLQAIQFNVNMMPCRV